MEELSKEVYHDVRKMVKKQLFGKGKPKPYIVPKITKCEETFSKLVGKTYGRGVTELAHVKSADKWFRALRFRKKVFVLIEGRKKDKWWTITFSHGFDRNSKIYILREIMRQNKVFAPAFKRGIIKKDIDVLIVAGESWKKQCEGHIHKGKFAKHIDKILRQKATNKKAAHDRYMARPQVVRKQFEDIVSK